MKTAKIRLDSIKFTDGWAELAYELGISDEIREEHFLYGEYASLELEIDDELNVVGGRILPIKTK